MKQIIKSLAVTIAVASSVWISNTSLATQPSPSMNNRNLQSQVNDFLEMYNRIGQRLSTVSSEASWKSGTDVKPEHTGQRIGAEEANAAFVGNTYIIQKTKEFLKHDKELSDLQRRQLKMILLNAAAYPGTIPEIVSTRVAAEARQSATMDSFEFKYRPAGASQEKNITANDIDEILLESRNIEERKAIWLASKQSGVALKPGLIRLRDLRNQVAREMGFNSFYAMQAAYFGMDVKEMRALHNDLVTQLRPLYEQLHCWAKHKLAERYKQDVPKLIPAHWIGNRWSQEWPGLVEGVDFDPAFKTKTPEWIVRSAVEFGESMGLPKVPSSFWQKSDLYELPAGAPRKKNTHASAWHLDSDQDVRSLMSVKPNYSWFATAHHELGHIFYDLSYANPQVPYVLRNGASPSFHEGMAEIMSISASQLPYLRRMGIVKQDAAVDQVQWLLNVALEQVIFIPWSAGVMAAWEHDLYESNLPTDQFNKRWWEYVAQYQGVCPPENRGEEFCDAATKTHINDDPARYYQYAIAFVTKYQLHMHIAKNILKQDPRNCDYYGNKKVGEFLYGIMKPGATRDWRQLIKEATGKELSAAPMLEYFEPLTQWLKEQNQGRSVKWQ